MIRSILLVAVGILAALCVACAPQPTVVGGLARTACNGADLTNRVQFVQNRAVTKSVSLTAAMTADLQSAYCNAPDVFRHHIDSVGYIFIDITGCRPVNGVMTCPLANGEGGSWGMRMPGGYTQIGNPAGIWGQTPWAQPAPSAEPYTTFETAGLQYLVQQLPFGPYSSTANLPYFPPAQLGSTLGQSWVTVLAALAHELGHIRWYEVADRAGYGQPYDFSRLNSCPVNSGVGTTGFFAGWSNQTVPYLTYSRRWRDFGNLSTDQQNDHAMPPSMGLYRPGNTDATRETLISEIYATNQPWVSFLAANVPEEDFVETYKFDILTKAGLTSMPLTIPSGNGSNLSPEDIFADYYNNGGTPLKTTLAAKVACLKQVR